MSDTYTVQTYRDGALVDTSTLTVPYSPTDADQATIRANIAGAKTALRQATQTVTGATSATALAALQQYVAANNQAWDALLPALKYIAERLAS